MSQLLDCILILPGAHYMARRFGSVAIKRRAFDAKYRRGGWLAFDKAIDLDLAGVLQRRLRQGRMLMLGCGTSSIITALPVDSYSEIVGVDLSSEAIKIAQAHANPKVRFEIADIAACECDGIFDVVLFEESINYISISELPGVLNFYASRLAPDGCFVVTISQTERYAAILELIRSSRSILDDRRLQGTNRSLLVFR